MIADHIEHIAKVCGVDCVGIGSDFDGIPTTPAGLEGVDKFPGLFIELARRGWYTTRPNPRVGCVITHGNVVRGEGWHERAGQAHAEGRAKTWPEPHAPLLSSFDVFSLIVNKMIGTGIYTNVATVLILTGDKDLTMALWATRFAVRVSKALARNSYFVLLE